MGARQQAQKRRKHQQGNEKGSPWSQKKSSSSLHVPNLDPSLRHRALLSGWQDHSDSSSPPSRNGFSMSQEARNTERHTLGWSSTRLRDNAVSFVSAGLLNRDELEDQQRMPEDGDETTEGKQWTPEDEDEPIEGKQLTSITATPVLPPQEVLPTSINLLGQEDVERSSTHDTIIVDGNDSSQIQEQAEIVVPTQRLRLSSVSSSSSRSSDEVVFSGRSKVITVTARPKIPTPEAAESKTSPSPVTHNVIVKPQVNGNHSGAKQNVEVIRTPLQTPSSISKARVLSHSRRSVNSRLKPRHRKPHPADLTDEEEAIMRVYIENMAMDDDEDDLEGDTGPGEIKKPKHRRNETYRLYDGSGEEHAKVQMKSTNKTTMPDVDLGQAIDWSSGDLEEFDDVDTTDDEIADIDQVLRRRERASGLQYLVTAPGENATSAKWILHSKLITPSAQEEIRIFEEIQLMEIEEHSGDEVTSDSEEDEALNDLLEDIESEDDENEKIFRHTARMTDEQIARALAKQESLGMGGDELLLFSGDVADDLGDDDEGDGFADDADFIPFSAKKHTSNRTRSKRNKRNPDHFPSAELFAEVLEQDPYGGFDVMDFDRPSLRPRRKGRKSNPLLEFELEDEELAQQLYNAWTKDREKKAARKREKQEFQQALLLESAERNDPAVIKAEIRQFLISEADSLKLAPMEAHIRAAVHRLAKSLKLNSRSEGKEGKGVGRFPVLTKTAHTPRYTIDTVWQIDALLNTKKFFPKQSSSLRGTLTKSNRGRGGGGGNYSGATVRNGEVVGGSAPEISADNKGRAMLEKMGWTSGMGIGAVGNKGSIEVIKHVVKTTKAGLG